VQGDGWYLPGVMVGLVAMNHLLSPLGARLRTVLTVVALSTAALVFVTSLVPASALAICKDPPCIKEPPPAPTPAPPVTTKITSISPSYAWSGDTITINGTGFSGASVMVNGITVNPTSAASTKLVVVVPTITNAPSGPVSIPVVVSSPTGTASSSITLSPTLQTSKYGTWGVNAEFGQGADGYARATATLDRSSGFEHSDLTVVNAQTWLSLSINMSTAWLDDGGRVIGYTPARNVTSTGWMYHWPSGDTTATGSFTDVISPNPGVAPHTRRAEIILVRDHSSELMSALSNAVALGQTIATVIKTVAAFLV
jgi:hypothetical protein